jgi:hypothetical protein
MKTQRHGKAAAESRQLEVGTMRARVAVCAGEIFSARANGFSPRLFDFVGKIGARTVHRSGVSSVRLMRHCPRSYELFAAKRWSRHSVRAVFVLRTNGAHGVTRPTEKLNKKLAGRQKMVYVESV